MAKKPLKTHFQTTLASGTYCDIISGGMLNKKCLGISITVNEGGNAEFAISNLQESPFIVIHMKVIIPNNFNSGKKCMYAVLQNTS